MSPTAERDSLRLALASLTAMRTELQKWSTVLEDRDGPTALGHVVSAMTKIGKRLDLLHVEIARKM